MTAHEARETITEAHAGLTDLVRGLSWDTTPAYVADTNDGGHYRVIELPEHLVAADRFLAVRSRTDDRGKLWEYMVGRFPTLDVALTNCWTDYKS